VKNLILTAVCLFALAACDKPASDAKVEDKNAPTTTNGTATAVTTAATPTPAPVTINDGDLSTPADFEETAEKTITAKTYKADLASLEADVAKE
jgi:hypothetical protein